jgi:hypothetical protein
MLQHQEEIALYRLSLIKDLEKNLKLAYESQYKNILTNIAVGKKRFIRKKMAQDASEYAGKYNSVAVNLVNYLINLFDVFGESALLNAKKLFEENGQKWGKKLKRKLLNDIKKNEISQYVKNVYIDMEKQDYIELHGRELIWYFRKDLLKSGGEKYYGAFYDIKKAWLHAFIEAFSPEHMSVFETVKESEDEIVTNIIIKEGAS